MQHVYCECESLAREQRRQIRPVLARMNHQGAQRGAGLAKIRVKARQIATENAVSLAAQPDSKLGSEARLGRKEFQV